MNNMQKLLMAIYARRAKQINASWRYIAASYSGKVYAGRHKPNFMTDLCCWGWSELPTLIGNIGELENCSQQVLIRTLVKL